MAHFGIFIITLGFTALLMYWLWIWAVRIKNFGVVDAAWSGAFLLQALLFALYSDGWFWRKIVFFLMVGAWSFRLAYYLGTRIYQHHPEEDTRYVQLRREYGENYEKRFLIFFMIQAASVSVLTLPFIFAFDNASAGFEILEYAGLGSFILSLLGESLADLQLKVFKSNLANKGRVCDVGLWRYSRHPNYFFESCIWFSFFIFMLGTPGLVWALYAPLIILYLLVKVTGVPPSEAQSLKSRGDLYRAYQRQTSVFVPWFRKEES